jgi:hypothetical protein
MPQCDTQATSALDRRVPGFDRVARVFDVAEYDVVRLHAGANR